jgi:hypothetical protein
MSPANGYGTSDILCAEHNSGHVYSVIGFILVWSIQVQWEIWNKNLFLKALPMFFVVFALTWCWRKFVWRSKDSFAFVSRANYRHR